MKPASRFSNSTLKSIMGVAPAHSGRIEFKGQDIRGLKADRIVPMGIVASPLDEIVPDAASEKRVARAGVAPKARRVNKRSAAVAERVVIAMESPPFTAFVAWKIPFQTILPSNHPQRRPKHCLE